MIHGRGWLCECVGRAQTVSVVVGAKVRARLAADVSDRNRPQKHVQGARIVLLSAQRLSVVAVAAQAWVSRPSVWRWQQRFDVAPGFRTVRLFSYAAQAMVMNRPGFAGGSNS